MGKLSSFSDGAVAHPDLDLRQRVQHIQLGQGDLGEAVQLCGEGYQVGVEPAAAARPARDGAEFLALILQHLSGGIIQLGGHGAAPDPGGIGLGHPDHPPDAAWGDPQPGGRPSGYDGGSSAIGVSPPGVVQQGALGTFQQDIGAFLEGCL